MRCSASKAGIIGKAIACRYAKYRMSPEGAGKPVRMLGFAAKACLRETRRISAPKKSIGQAMQQNPAGYLTSNIFFVSVNDPAVRR